MDDVVHDSRSFTPRNSVLSAVTLTSFGPTHTTHHAVYLTNALCSFVILEKRTRQGLDPSDPNAALCLRLMGSFSSREEAASCVSKLYHIVLPEKVSKDRCAYGWYWIRCHLIDRSPTDGLSRQSIVRLHPWPGFIEVGLSGPSRLAA